ncbi:ABC transporter ATP-binding protein [Tepidibacillus marianensis]|uniref:ABC transporter ATP-binding protein n=1 Tax=Tepidibacillus marianensis TaxID=3131995 RepID=UPI0030D26DA9
MIEFSNVSKRYGTKSALKDVSFKIPTGKIIGLVGPNGSGKSTTLKLIAGLIRPTNGTVRVFDREVGRMSSSFISYLSELDAYYPFYTVEETIDFYASQFGDFNFQKANEILGFMQLDPKQKVKHLSKGNRGRLKILLSLSRDVPLIMMDEPLSGLDPMVRESIVKGLISFIDLEKQTVVLTTHEISEIEPVLDQVVAIKEGNVIASVNIDEIRELEGLSILQWMKKMYEEENHS